MATQADDASRPQLHPIGRLYAQWVFKFLIDIACAIADDFAERPQHYKVVTNELSDTLSGFRYLLGSHPDWPDTHQRIALFRALGGAYLAGISAMFHFASPGPGV
jgi:hypothetical protein